MSFLEQNYFSDVSSKVGCRK